MKDISATTAAREFSSMLDEIERRGESFLIVRRGRPIAHIEPATYGSGRTVKDLLSRAPHDPDWLNDVQQVRSSAVVEERRWPD